MLKNNYLGKFVALEGLDGAGKSTQAQMIAAYLAQNGKSVHLTQEPSRFLTGDLIRRRLLGEWQSSPECLQLLFAADRAQHLEKEILPALETGAIVIGDRYFLSSLAYGAVDLDLDWLAQINSQFLLPDLIIYLDVPAEVCAQRIIDNGRSIELFEKKEILQKVAQNYQKSMAMFEKQTKIVIINGNQSKEEVFGEIKKSLKNYG